MNDVFGCDEIKMSQKGPWSRREVFRTAVAAGIASALGAQARGGGAELADPERIQRENEAGGTRDWMTTHVRVDPKTRFRSPWIEGFVSKTSARPGETITLHVSTNPPSPSTIDIYRLGYYQVHGGRFMTRLGPLQGQVQSDPSIGAIRVRECAREPCATLAIPQDWTSGVYLGKLTAERESLQSYVVFVVRDDRKADFLFQVSDNTWNAYNRWPNQFALYDDGKNAWYVGPNVKKAVEDGVNVAFLSGNAVCFVTPLLPSADGRPGRVITRRARFGKTEAEQLELRPETGLFTESGPDEGTLIGARNIYPVIGGGDWICRKPNHWLFEGTGMKEGDAIPGLVGWEWHGAPAAIAGLEVLASGPAKTPKTEGTYTATTYPGPKGNLVFNAATIWWADGLSEPPGYVRPKAYTTPHGPDPRVQGITRNLFERFRQL